MKSSTPRTSHPFDHSLAREGDLGMCEANIRWGLCILCVLLIGALITSYYLQIKKIRAIHETVISIFAGMVVGLIIRLSPGHVIREMLVSHGQAASLRADLSRFLCKRGQLASLPVGS